MENIDIFEIIKNKKYNLLKKIIKKNKNINFDIKDKHFNYPIHYLVKYNDYEIIDFVLSCRIMGRMVEESMLYVVAKYAQSEKLKELIAEYISTPKNTPCLEFWKKKSKFLYNEPQNIFSLKINGKYPKPDCVQLEGI